MGCNGMVEMGPLHQAVSIDRYFVPNWQIEAGRTILDHAQKILLAHFLQTVYLEVDQWTERLYLLLHAKVRAGTLLVSWYQAG